MKITIYSTDGKETGSITLVPELLTPVRADLIKRAVLYIQSLSRQPYGAAPRAGMRHSAELSRRRRKYRGSYGKGISRVQRKILSRRGSQMFWVGAVVPGTVGGRRAHPPKADKIWEKGLNIKENRKAILSALNASLTKDVVENRGHIVPDTYPLGVADAFEDVTKTQQAITTLKTLGFEQELVRGAVKTIRAGKGKNRGRPYKGKKSLLVIVSKNCPLKDALSNVPGVDVARINELNAELLAPGTHPGRAVLFTEAALTEWNTKKLYA